MSGIDKNAEAFLGRGWSFPPEFNEETGDVAMTVENADIENSLRILFSTAAGERFLVPTFGLDLHEMQFEPMSTTMRTFLQDRIKIGILVFEARIVVHEIAVQSPTTPDGTLLVSLDYSIRATNSRYNLVLPFYLNEAEVRAAAVPRHP